MRLQTFAMVPALLALIGTSSCAIGFVLPEIKVLGPAARELPALRQAYVGDVQALEEIGLNARAAAATGEETARMLHQMRRDIGEKYKNVSPPEKASGDIRKEP